MVEKSKNKEKGNRREFSISELEKEVSWSELIGKREICEKKRHKHDKKTEYFSSGAGGTNINGYCSRCGMIYSRYMNSNDVEEFDDTMSRGFDI